MHLYFVIKNWMNLALNCGIERKKKGKEKTTGSDLLLKDKSWVSVWECGILPITKTNRKNIEREETQNNSVKSGHKSKTFQTDFADLLLLFFLACSLALFFFINIVKKHTDTHFIKRSKKKRGQKKKNHLYAVFFPLSTTANLTLFLF